MKTSLKILAIITLALLLSLNGFCQLPTIKATSQGWAGGVCCRTGTDYHITLTGKKGTLDNFKVTSVCISGLQFSSDQIRVSSVTNGTETTVHLNMGVTRNEAEDRPDKIKEEVQQPACTDMQVNYSTGKKRQTLIIGQVEALPFIAYP
ncbi:MAG TPA: hypothetical protein VD905_21330 [Flavobacteriales bacterium]|nr:hypothetical protein [Flavobacteriales bacterium]